MPVIRVTHMYDYAGQRCENTYHYAHPTISPSAAHVNDLLVGFETIMLPAINDVQVTQVTNVALVGYAYNLGYSIERLTGGTGSIVSVPAGNIPADIALIVKRQLNPTLLLDGEALYTGNRPIRRGHFFLSGLPKNNMSGTGFTYDTFEPEWDALSELQDQAFILGTGGTWRQVVFGNQLPALPPSDTNPYGKPLRPWVVAPVTGILPQNFTNISTRDL